MSTMCFTELLKSKKQTLEISLTKGGNGFGMGLSDINQGENITYNRVTKLLPGGPAQNAGLMMYDQIVSIDGKPIDGPIPLDVLKSSQKLDLVVERPALGEEFEFGLQQMAVERAQHELLPLLKGALSKQSPRWPYPWQTREFVVDAEALRYTSGKGEKKAVALFDVESVVSARDKRNEFVVQTTAGRAYRLRPADKLYSSDEWVATLNTQLDRVRQDM